MRKDANLALPTAASALHALLAHSIKPMSQREVLTPDQARAAGRKSISSLTRQRLEEQVTLVSGGATKRGMCLIA